MEQPAVEVFKKLNADTFNDRSKSRVIPFAMWEDKQGSEGEVDLSEPYRWGAAKLLEEVAQRQQQVGQEGGEGVTRASTSSAQLFRRLPFREKREEIRKRELSGGTDGESDLPLSWALSPHAVQITSTSSSSSSPFSSSSSSSAVAASQKLVELPAVIEDKSRDGYVDKIREFFDSQLCVRLFFKCKYYILLH